MNREHLAKLIATYEKPSRKAVSTQLPVLKKPIILTRRFAKKVQNITNLKIARKKSAVFFVCVIARHQSVLLRKLGDSEERLQKNKITNLKRACEDLNGLIIKPRKIFSLWETIGQPTYHRGYVDGMLLANGKVVEGVGGGLCQLSNLLCWLLLHADTKIVERYHHSLDVFPDSGRVLPFGSGATCLYNFVDLKIKNSGKQPLQLKIWVTDKHLKAQLLSPEPAREKLSLQEKNHAFIKKGKKFFRYNEIWRTKKIEGKESGRELIFQNFAPVLYKINEKEIKGNGYEFFEIKI
jgi:vancomycin resistance protein VanW